MGHNHPKTHSPVGEAGTGSGLRSCWWLKQWEQAAWVGQSQAQHNTAPEVVEISEFCEKRIPNLHTLHLRKKVTEL